LQSVLFGGKLCRAAPASFPFVQRVPMLHNFALRRVLGATLVVAATALLAIHDCASFASTTALYDFDTIGGNNVGPGGLKFFDSVGSFDFTSHTNAGTMSLTTDQAAIMPSNGTLALECESCGARGLFTQPTNELQRQSTGMTVEFWFKYKQPPASIGYLLNFDAGTDGCANAATCKGDWGVYVNGFGDTVPVFFEYSTGFPEISTFDLGIADPSDGNWHHIAFTVDTGNVARSYIDGQLIKQTAFGAPISPLTGTLSLGSKGSDGFGAHHFLMDDLRISDAALLPGSGSGTNELAWNAPLSVAPTVDRPEDFGRQWVRQHDFTISSWGYTTHPDQYNAANFNAALGGEFNTLNANGTMPMYLGALTQLNDQTRTTVQHWLSAGAKAFLLKDELKFEEIAGFKEVAEYIRSVDSDALIIAGLSGSTPSYVDQVITEGKPDAVIHGFYPFNGATSATDRWYVGGLTDVALVRERALYHHVPYFAFVQSFDDQVSSANPPDFRRRLPSESELRAELFSKLSAGIKGFAYFVFENGTNEDIALVDPTGVPSSLYAPAAAANQEVARIGASLRYLESSNWRFVSGGAPTPEYMEAWNSSVGFGKLLGISINGAQADRKDALVGTFLDDDGGEYFMLVNTFHSSSLDAAGAAVGFTLTFDSSVDAVFRLNRQSGLVEELAVVGNTLSLTLPGGTGDLFKFGNGQFAGLAVSLPGDFNGDLRVDAADYTVWRDRNGSPEEYLTWKSNFGRTASGAGQANGSIGSVPEPTAGMMFLLGAACLAPRFVRRSTRG
jgi:hypothetical protein